MFLTRVCAACGASWSTTYHRGRYKCQGCGAMHSLTLPRLSRNPLEQKRQARAFNRWTVEWMEENPSIFPAGAWCWVSKKRFSKSSVDDARIAMQLGIRSVKAAQRLIRQGFKNIRAGQEIAAGLVECASLIQEATVASCQRSVGR